MSTHNATTTVLPGQTVTIFGYAFKASSSFSPYEAFENYHTEKDLEPEVWIFNKRELTTEQIQGFIDWLNGKLGYYVEPDSLKNMDLPSFLNWDYIPSKADVDETYAILQARGVVDVNQYLLEQVASGYISKSWIDNSFTREDYFAWLNEVGAVDHPSLSKTRFQIVKDVLDARVDANIARVGWSIQGVGACKEFPQYAYTVGLHHKTGFEITFCGGLPMNLIQDLLNELAEKGVEKTLVLDQPFLMKTIRMQSGEALRAVVMDVTGPKALEYVLDRRSQGGKIYQVFLGDDNNKLPHEVMRKTDFKQPSLRTTN